MLPDDQVQPDTHVLTKVNNVIGLLNYVIAAGPSLLNFMIADTLSPQNFATSLARRELGLPLAATVKHRPPNTTDIQGKAPEGPMGQSGRGVD